MANRTKNATRNIVFGTILKTYQIAAPFLTRTLMIRFMSIEYTGLSGLFASILQVLNLAELGVGSAMVYSMYKPIAENDTKKIQALMNAYRQYYRIIGTVIAAIGLALTPFIPKLINGNPVPELNVYALYLISLSATVLSYWLFAYKNSIITAHQRSDIISKANIVSSTVLYLIQIASIVIFKNYYIFISATVISQILTNIIIFFVANKLYPQYKPSGILDKAEKQQINKRIRDLFTAKIGSVIVNSADTIIISAFLGLETLAIYQNYFYIITALIGVLGIVHHACMASIGNSIVTETKNKNYHDLQKYTFLIMFIVGLSAICLLNLFQPFMDIWVGKELELEFSAVICFAIYFYVYEFNQLLCTYKDAGGIWHQDRLRPLITALTNLILNIASVHFLGIYGVILSTVVSTLLIGTPWLIKNLFSTIFESAQKRDYITNIIIYSFTTILSGTICYIICDFVPHIKYIELIIKTIICISITTSIYIATYRSLPVYAESKKLTRKMFKSLRKEK